MNTLKSFYGAGRSNLSKRVFISSNFGMFFFPNGLTFPSYARPRLILLEGGASSSFLTENIDFDLLILIGFIS